MLLIVIKLIDRFVTVTETTEEALRLERHTYFRRARHCFVAFNAKETIVIPFGEFGSVLFKDSERFEDRKIVFDITEELFELNVKEYFRVFYKGNPDKDSVLIGVVIAQILKNNV